MSRIKTLGFLYALIAVSIWSGNFIIASGMVNTLPPITLAALRWCTATIVLIPFAVKAIRRDQKALLAYKWSTLTAAITGVTLFNTLVYISARTTDTANMALFASTTPIFVVILSRIFLGEAISYLRAFGLAIAVAGMLIIATHGNIDTLLHMTFRVGDIWMLLAGLLWAIYSILVKRKPSDISQYSFLGALFFIGAIPLIPAAFVEQCYSPNWAMTPSILGATVYIGIGASLVAFFLWNQAVTHIGPGTSSLFQYFMPIFSSIGAFFLLDQPITHSHVVGFVLIFTGVILATRSK
ncbi:DMT family transporter [Pseudodesulfovibrio piezophilus]|uniref:EamA domain-containing protein n=1 Tax=Pseudodesulfovibrio piezophilus (strain DSM 21447 / JCM 15486 / C1TLV30) TaxID=1322246 RepID=M1WUX3_PSEP2|nr:DMT family transporter [Pseudodesulfovibrio piezophilus]CCH47958.1 conserved membrane protein of unknown function [Pseudodesulfovibrio piezophilus C1TLV30]